MNTFSLGSTGTDIQFATMSDVNDVMASIYDSLLQLRYPHISNVELKDIEAMILNGENRVCLLSWLLMEKSPLIAIQLKKLNDAALKGISVFI